MHLRSLEETSTDSDSLAALRELVLDGTKPWSNDLSSISSHEPDDENRIRSRSRSSGSLSLSAERMDLEEAIEQGDWNALEREAKAIVGSSKSLGVGLLPHESKREDGNSSSSSVSSESNMEQILLLPQDTIDEHPSITRDDDDHHHHNESNPRESTTHEGSIAASTSSNDWNTSNDGGESSSSIDSEHFAAIEQMIDDNDLNGLIHHAARSK